MGDMQMNNFLMPPFLSLLPVTHFSSCFFSVLLCSPPSPLPFLLPLLFCILYPAIFPLWMVWWKRLALRDCTEAKPQLILLSRGMADFFWKLSPHLWNFKWRSILFCILIQQFLISQLKNPNPDSQGNSLFHGQGVASSEERLLLEHLCCLHKPSKSLFPALLYLLSKFAPCFPQQISYC